ncbi:MAG: pyridoxamine 5'-phosphate oxidase family protein [Tetrasphaera sp.]|nr:pyridoxamine 5'-phosphate oxidase family protein [Tetrasphaera sp.]
MSEPTHATQPEPTVPDDASGRTHDSDPEPSQGPEHDVPRFTELVADFRTCMFSTIGPDGLIHSRPMAIQEVATDGTVWFFDLPTPRKLAQLDTPAGVNLTFGNDRRFVSVSGSATVVDDLAKKRELWNPWPSWARAPPPTATTPNSTWADPLRASAQSVRGALSPSLAG